jgi:hypothetical protein
MLTGDDPAVRFAAAGLAHMQEVHVLSVEGGARDFESHARLDERPRDEPRVSFHRVGRKIGVVDGIVLGPMVDRQDRPVVRGRDAEPVPAIVGSAGAIVLPALRICGAPGIHDPKRAILTARPDEAEVKPLIEVGIAVLVDSEPDVRWVRTIETLDIPGIEIAADSH